MLFPVHLDSRATIARTTEKELFESVAGVVPVKWRGSWAVVVLDAYEKRCADWLLLVAVDGLQ